MCIWLDTYQNIWNKSTKLISKFLLLCVEKIVYCLFLALNVSVTEPNVIKNVILSFCSWQNWINIMKVLESIRLMLLNQIYSILICRSSVYITLDLKGVWSWIVSCILVTSKGMRYLFHSSYHIFQICYTYVSNLLLILWHFYNSCLCICVSFTTLY